MAPIMKQNSNIWLLMVGGAPADFIGEVTAPIYQENVIDQFKMVPLVSAEKMAGVMNLADVYVYPDASSLSCLEAAACGRSCIVTDLPAGKAREEAGLAVSYQRGNVEHLRGMISNLISSPSARKKIGDKARSSVVEGFSYDAIAGRLEIMLRQAVDVYGTTNAC